MPLTFGENLHSLSSKTFVRLAPNFALNTRLKDRALYQFNLPNSRPSLQRDIEAYCQKTLMPGYLPKEISCWFQLFKFLLSNPDIKQLLAVLPQAPQNLPLELLTKDILMLLIYVEFSSLILFLIIIQIRNLDNMFFRFNCNNSSKELPYSYYHQRQDYHCVVKSFHDQDLDLGGYFLLIFLGD